MLTNHPAHEAWRSLRANYGSIFEKPFPALRGMSRAVEPGCPFDTSDLRWEEVKEIVRKARASSAPGITGISNELYNWRSAHAYKRSYGGCWRWRGKHHQSLESGMLLFYIPKKSNSESLQQFRPTSLLNVDRKILFSVLVRRLTTFVLGIDFIGTSNRSKCQAWEERPACNLVGCSQCSWLCTTQVD